MREDQIRRFAAHGGGAATLIDLAAYDDRGALVLRPAPEDAGSLTFRREGLRIRHLQFFSGFRRPQGLI